MNQAQRRYGACVERGAALRECWRELLTQSRQEEEASWFGAGGKNTRRSAAGEGGRGNDPRASEN